MKSVTEYTRQLNHQSVTLPGLWLDRLQRVECPHSERSPAPEIVLTEPCDIRSSGSVYSEPPVTIVNQATASMIPGVPAETNPALRAADTRIPEIPLDPGPADQPRTGPGYLEPVDTGQPPVQALPGIPTTADVWSGPDDDTVPMDIVNPPGAEPGIPSPASLEDPSTAETGLQQDNTLVSSVVDSFNLPADQHGLPGAAGCPTKSEPVPDAMADCQAERATARAGGVLPATGQALPDSPFPPRFDYRQCPGPKSIERLVDRLVDRFPPVASATVMLMADTANIDVDGITGRVATCLANRELGGILLVDANTSTRQLTAVMENNQAPGLANLINQSDSLSAAICPTDHSRLEFLPCGTGDWSGSHLDAARCTALTREFNQSFQFTLVSGGVAGHGRVQHWARYLDAVYLLIDLDAADRDHTMRTVSGLRGQGVRVAGCILVQS